MIFAIGTQLLDFRIGFGGCTRTFYGKAFEVISSIVEHTTIHTVQAYLMLAVFSQKVPDGSSVWQTAGMAIRAAIALELHR